MIVASLTREIRRNGKLFRRHLPLRLLPRYLARKGVSQVKSYNNAMKRRVAWIRTRKSWLVTLLLPSSLPNKSKRPCLRLSRLQKSKPRTV